jgi:hypothetical protein
LHEHLRTESAKRSLHGLHELTMFQRAEGPLKARGTMWSMVTVLNAISVRQ